MKTSVLDTSLSVHLLSAIFGLHKFYCTKSWLGLALCVRRLSIEMIIKSDQLSTIHQLRLRLSITIDFNSSPRVHINYQLKGHNHEDECNITQKKTLHTLIFHRGTTSWNNVSSCRYSCRYLVYFPKHCQILPPVQTACLVTSVDCGPSWAAWVGGVELPCITEHRTPSRIGDIMKPWTLCLDWGRWKDDTNCAWLYCIVIVQSWFSHFYKLSMFLTLRKNETKHVNDINIHDSECCVITEQHQHFSITGHK